MLKVVTMIVTDDPGGLRNGKLPRRNKTLIRQHYFLHKYRIDFLCIAIGVATLKDGSFESASYIYKL
jgi:hypothetical protein